MLRRWSWGVEVVEWRGRQFQSLVFRRVKGKVRAILVPEEEVSRLVENLEEIPLSEYGSARWMRQHSVLERLNAQAHANAVSGGDPYVLSAFLTFEKLGVLVRQLLVSEQWVTHVFPRVLGRVRQGRSLRLYYMLFEEALLANLLEAFFFHDYAVEALGDALVDVVDWVSRRLGELIARSHRGRQRQRRRQRLVRRGKLAPGEAPDSDPEGSADENLFAPPSASAVWRAGKEGRGAEGSKGTGAEDRKGRGAEDRKGSEGGRKGKRGSKTSPPSPSSPSSPTFQLPSEESQRRAQRAELRFRTGCSAVAILRYIAEAQASAACSLPVSVPARILDTHDLLCALVPLIENPPWTRRKVLRRRRKREAGGGGGVGEVGEVGEGEEEVEEEEVWEKFVDGEWRVVETSELLRVTRTEAQAWLGFFALLTAPESRRRYALTSARKGTLGRVRKYLNEVLVDQLPVLVDVQRILDELQVAEVPVATAAGGAGPAVGLMMEVVPEITEAVVREAFQATGAQDAHRAAPASISSASASSAKTITEAQAASRTIDASISAPSATATPTSSSASPSPILLTTPSSSSSSSEPLLKPRKKKGDKGTGGKEEEGTVEEKEEGGGGAAPPVAKTSTTTSSPTTTKPRISFPGWIDDPKVRKAVEAGGGSVDRRWDIVARVSLHHAFAVADKDDPAIREIAGLYTDEAFGDLLSAELTATTDTKKAVAKDSGKITVLKD